MKARIHVTLKRGVLDPQGKAVKNALEALGFVGIEDVRQGKYIEVNLTDSDYEVTEDRVKSMCEKLLANTVIENYDVEIEK